MRSERLITAFLDAEAFRLNIDNTILEIGKKPTSVEEMEGKYMGLLFFSPEGWKEIKTICKLITPEKFNQSYMTCLLQEIIEVGRVKLDPIRH